MADPVLATVAPKPGSLEDHEVRLLALEMWAKTTPGMLFQPPAMAHGGKVTAYYKAPDGVFWKYHMDPIDYAEASQWEPAAWTLETPALNAKVMDKTSTPLHNVARAAR
jgi:hypothetical protein